jgi:Icc-related predicted phosphoesterase
MCNIASEHASPGARHPPYNSAVPTLKVLSVSDRVVEFIYNETAAQRFKDVDLVLACGDLPYYYVEYLVDVIEAPVFYVRGNHAPLVEYTQMGERQGPWGASDLHRRLVRHDGLLIAGFEGCLRYRPGPFQYTQGEMWGMVLAMLPRLIWNRLVRGRALDILVTHAPAWGVGDQPDPAHRGFKAFRWLLKVFRPRYHFHGHIHIYSDDTPVHSRFEATHVINTYGHVETELELSER